MKTIKIKYLKLTWSIISMCVFSVNGQVTSLPVPNKQQLAWQKAELGVVFHYDLHVFDTSKYNQGINRITPVADYNIFNPQKLDVEQWVISAKAAGAKFAILTVTHETGFALFQSDVNPYSMKSLKFKEGKADLFKDFTDACRKHGIKPGVYLGIRWNSFFGVHDFVVDGDPSEEMQKKRQAYYNNMVEGMVKEICTNYGPLFEIWFDGGASSPDKGAPDVLPIVKKYQPDCLFYHNDQLAEARWGGSESGTVNYPCWSTFPYNYTGSGESAIPGISKNGFSVLKGGDPDGKYWVPAMADAPLRGSNGRHEWFWEPGDENSIYPLEELMDIYYKSVGRNATLIMGLTPDNTGLMPKEDVQRLKEWGVEIKKRFDSPLAVTKGKGKSIELKLSKETTINQIVIQENIALGHRVRAFSIQIFENGKWQTINSGTAIGNKYIFLADRPVLTKKLRLLIDKSVGEPDIINFAVFNVEKN
ncbi:alpha-L-fucosidase [Flavobacterium sp. TMP13]|uniref:alpha-L-fucosidase n=1 Tax=Flavobacterium sp. TMP13 TaxID=3425950 RepID=UPI003D789D15